MDLHVALLLEVALLHRLLFLLVLCFHSRNLVGFRVVQDQGEQTRNTRRVQGEQGFKVSKRGTRDAWPSLFACALPALAQSATRHEFVSRDRLRVGWEGYRESRRCSRDTYPESYITKYTSIRRLSSEKRTT